MLLAAASFAAVLGSSAMAAAAATMPCASDDEARGFVLRHLQSKLMVAALSCNQRDAYNTFMQRFMPELTDSGKAFAAYFTRTGLGAPALNSHVTEIANAAGLSRAANPRYCEATWQLFWDLQQAPERLVEYAAENQMTAMTVPQSCAAAAPARRPVPNRTAAPLDREAAVR
jgi:hypothetical protein